MYLCFSLIGKLHGVHVKQQPDKTTQTNNRLTFASLLMTPRSIGLPGVARLLVTYLASPR